MKFPIQRRTAKPKGLTDEAIRRRIADLPPPSVETSSNVLRLLSSPKRAHTVPARRLLSPQPEILVSTIPQTVEAVNGDENGGVGSAEQKQRLPRRSASVAYRSPDQETENIERTPPLPRGSEQDNIDNSTPYDLHPKTSKKASPGFTINRNSIREPLQFVKQQGKQLFRRGGIKALFPVTSEQNTVEGLQDKEEVESSEIRSTNNSQTQAVESLETQHESTRSRYYIARQARNDSQSSVPTGFVINNDAAFYTPEINNPWLQPPREEENEEEEEEDVVVLRDWPTRVSSLNSVITQLQVIQPLISSPDLPATPTTPVALSRQNSQHSLTLEEIVRAGLAPSSSDSSIDYDRNDAVAAMRANQTSTKGVNFKNAHKNFFPLWANERRADGRRYIQVEIIDRISPSL